MRRRAFLGALIGVVAAPAVAQAQPAKVPVIGVLVLGIPDPQPFLKALREGFAGLGYVEGRNIRLEVRDAGGQSDLLAGRAAELVRLKPDVIVVFQTPAALAAKQATSDIPIVMSHVGDPVASGLVTSLARPGGNVTGMAGGAAEIAGKIVELIREMLPGTRRVAALINLSDPFGKLFAEGVASGARTLGIDMESVGIHPREPVEAAFETMAARKVDAAITMSTIFRPDVAELAVKRRLPLFATAPFITAAGGLASYSPDYAAMWRETAAYVDRILKGTKPADLPVAFPTRFELVINLKTAKAIGLEISSLLLNRADEVIE